MRTALSFILGIFLTLRLSALPNVRTGALPGWLYDNHPRLDKVPSREDISDGYYYELLDLQSNLFYSTDFTHYIRNIVNGSGVQNASEVSVTFSPQFQHVIFHHIDIIRDGAVLHRLQTGRIKIVQEETEADEFQYNGLKRAFLNLEDVRKGDRIDVAYSIVGFNPVFGNRYSDQFSFNGETAVCNYYKTIITTSDRPLHVLTTNKAPEPAQRRLTMAGLYLGQPHPRRRRNKTRIEYAFVVQQRPNRLCHRMGRLDSRHRSGPQYLQPLSLSPSGRTNAKDLRVGNAVRGQ